MAAWFPNLRKSLAPAPRSVGSQLSTEVKSAAGGYVRDLAAQLTMQTGKEWTAERAVAEAYERIVWVFKPVNVIAENQKARRFVLTQGGEEVLEHPLTDLLNKKANPLESGKVFRKRLSAQVLLSPRGAFVEVQETNGGRPMRLDLLPPGRTRIVPGSGIDNRGNPVDPRDVRSLVDHYEVIEPDGIRRRSIDVDKVRWFRDPHPLDPYRGITPLEAAGLSVELDHYARLYNVSFMRNDGRPGGLIGVDGEFGDDVARDIESKLAKGPTGAGKLTVISAEGLSFIDPSAKPRDMSYAQLAKNAKIELLSSFGVPDTMMGNAGEKTYANAEQERLVFWQDTMPPHLDLIADGFDDDHDDDMVAGFDTSDVEVLQKLRDAALARAREEVAAGVRSIYSYAQMAGNLPEIENTIHTRSLYIASGKQPLPINNTDAETMGLGEQQNAGGGTAAAAPVDVADPGMAPGPGSADVAGGAVAAGGDGSGEGGPAPAAAGAGSAALRQAAGAPGAGAAPAAADGAAAALLAAAAAATAATQVKSLRGRGLIEVKAADLVDDVDSGALDALEAELAGVLEQLTVDWTSRALARVSSVKSRRYTRHWTPEGDRPVDKRVATKAIDPTYAVDEQTWAEEAQTATGPILVAAALVAASRTWSNLGGVGDLPGRARQAVVEMAGEVTEFIAASAAKAAAALVGVINEADQAGMPIDRIVETASTWSRRLGGWARQVATTAAVGSTEGARATVAEQLGLTPVATPGVTRPDDEPTNQPDQPTGQPDQPPTAAPVDVLKTWRTRRDDRVRETHRTADGQRQPAAGLFEVGGALLRWPGDPLAPPSEIRNCRCTVTYRSRSTGRFVARPKAMEAAQ